MGCTQSNIIALSPNLLRYSNKKLFIIELLIANRMLTVPDMLTIRICSNQCRQLIQTRTTSSMVFETLISNTQHILKIFDNVKLHIINVRTIPNIFDKLMELQKQNRLAGLSFVPRSHVDLDFKYLDSLTSLKYLSMTDFSISDDCLTRLRDLVDLSFYNQQPSGITDHGLSHLTNLTRLDITYPRITDRSLGCLTNLQKLILWENTVIIGCCFPFLLKLTYLASYYEMCIDDEHIRLATNLKKIILRQSSKIDGSGLMNMRNLTSLRVSSCGSSGNSAYFNVQNICALTNLIELRIEGDRLGGIFDLGNFVSLTHLSLKECPESLDHSVDKLTNLTHLELKDFKIKPDKLKPLGKLTTLKIINVDYYDKDLSHLTNLEQLHIFSNRTLTNRFLLNFTKIKTLYLASTGFRVEDFKHLRGLKRLCYWGPKPIWQDFLNIFPEIENINALINRFYGADELIHYNNNRFSLLRHKYIDDFQSSFFDNETLS